MEQRRTLANKIKPARNAEEGAPPPPLLPPPLDEPLLELEELLEEDELLDEEELLDDDEEEELLEEDELPDEDEDELELLLEDELELTVPMDSVADKLVALGLTPFETTQRNWSPAMDAETLVTLRVLVVAPE